MMEIYNTKVVIKSWKFVATLCCVELGGHSWHRAGDYVKDKFVSYSTVINAANYYARETSIEIAPNSPFPRDHL